MSRPSSSAGRPVFPRPPSAVAQSRAAPLLPSLHSSGGVFKLDRNDVTTYLAVLQQDCINVSSRLDSFSRSVGRPSTASRRPLDSASDPARATTEAIHSLITSTNKPTSQKLKILEYLNQSMVNLEIAVLNVTASAASSSATPTPIAIAQNNLDASLSRLPSHFALIDRVVDFYSQIIERAESGSSSSPAPVPSHSQSVSSASVSADQPREREPFNSSIVFESLRSFDSDLSLYESQFSASGSSSSRSLLAELVDSEECDSGDKIAQWINDFRERFNGLIEGFLSIKAANEAKKAEIEQLKNELKSAVARAKSGESAAPNKEHESSSSAAAAANTGDSDRFKKSIAELESQTAVMKDKIASLERDNAALAKRLDSEAEKAFQTLDRTNNDNLKQQEALKAKISDLERSLSHFKTEALKASESAKQSQFELAQERESSQRLKSEFLKKSIESSTDTQNIIPANYDELKQQFMELKDSFEREKRNFASLESMNRDIQVKLESDYKALQGENRGLKERNERSKRDWEELEEKYKGQIQKLIRTIEKNRKGNKSATAGKKGKDSDEDQDSEDEDESSFAFVLREEMRVMKQSFELKLTRQKEEFAAQLQSAQQANREIQAKWNEDKRILQQTKAKLQQLGAK